MMRWHDVLTGQGFKDWIVLLTEGSRITTGKALDPFTSSNRKLVRVSEFLENIQRDGSPDLPIEKLENGIVTIENKRKIDQAVVDLKRAYLVSDDGKSLSGLGDIVLESWKKYNINDNQEVNEIPRALILIHYALLNNNYYYIEIMSFWKQLREKYNVNTLFENRNFLAIVGYLNQEINGYNPWNVIYSTKSGMEVDFKKDWDDLIKKLSNVDSIWQELNNLLEGRDGKFEVGIETKIEDSINKFKKIIEGWATRLQGRVDFCMAMELICTPTNDVENKLNEWNIGLETIGKINEIIFDLESLCHSDPIIVRVNDLLMERKNIILYGPPGTGKTRTAFLLAENWRKKNGLDSVFSITFHPSYSYEDFVQGYRPSKEDPGKFTLEDGILLQVATIASEDKNTNFLMIIDEINRGDTARIFGELITYIEPDKRNHYFELSQSEKGKRYIPDNLYFLATMNTADKSISLLDVAMRRRFASIGIVPNYEVFKNDPDWLEEVEGINLGDFLKKINKKLRLIGIESDRAIGHALMKVEPHDSNPIKALRERLEFDILPLITEYCYMNRSMIKKVLGNIVDDEGELEKLTDDQFIEILQQS